MEHLGKIFDRHFEIERAHTPLLLDEALRLRYQVYCLENSYEQHTCYPDGREYDNFDLFSVHSFVRHSSTNLPAANVRLVLPRKGDREFHFPIQDHVSAQLLEEHCDWDWSCLHQTAEISRFCISRDFKQRLGEKHTFSGAAEQLQFPIGNAEEIRLVTNIDKVEKNSYYNTNGRMLPHITLGLFAAIFEMSAEEGLKHWFALMEPSLLKLLRRFGINFTCVGEPIEHRGPRQPCYAAIDDIALGIWEKRPDVWRFVTRNGEVWPLPEAVRNGKVVSAG